MKDLSHFLLNHVVKVSKIKNSQKIKTKEIVNIRGVDRYIMTRTTQQIMFSKKV